MFKKLTMAFAATIALVAGGAGVATAVPGGVPLGGGSGITLGDGTTDIFDCTLTTIGYDAAGRLVGFTAAHCGGPGATVKSERNMGAGVLGRVVAGNEALDYAVIQFDPGRVDRLAAIHWRHIELYGEYRPDKLGEGTELSILERGDDGF